MGDKSGGWSCSACTFVNTRQAGQCEMCLTPKPKGSGVKSPPPSTHKTSKSPPSGEPRRGSLFGSLKVKKEKNENKKDKKEDHSKKDKKEEPKKDEPKKEEPHKKDEEIHNGHGSKRGKKEPTLEEALGMDEDELKLAVGDEIEQPQVAPEEKKEKPQKKEAKLSKKKTKELAKAKEEKKGKDEQKEGGDEEVDIRRERRPSLLARFKGSGRRNSDGIEKAKTVEEDLGGSNWKASLQGKRSILFIVENASQDLLIRRGDPKLLSGTWARPPPAVIASQTEASFGVFANNVMQGVKGSYTFTIEGKGTFNFTFHSAKVGTPEAKCEHPKGYKVEKEGDLTKRAEIRYIIYESGKNKPDTLSRASASPDVVGFDDDELDAIVGKMIAAPAHKEDPPPHFKESPEESTDDEKEPDTTEPQPFSGFGESPFDHSSPEDHAPKLKLKMLSTEEAEEVKKQAAEALKSNTISLSAPPTSTGGSKRRRGPRGPAKEEGNTDQPSAGEVAPPLASSAPTEKPASPKTTEKPQKVEAEKEEKVEKETHTHNAPSQKEETEKEVHHKQESKPAPSASADATREASEEMKQASAYLDAGRFKDALPHVDKSLLILCSDVNTHKMQIKVCAQYKIALNLLIQITDLENTLKQTTEGADVVKCRIAQLAKHLSTLRLGAKHVIICMRMAITKNMDAGNYGVAADILRFLISKNPPDSAALTNRLEHCKQQGEKNNPAYLPCLIYCGKGLVPIPDNEKPLVCNACESPFAAKDNKAGWPCAVCQAGVLG